MDAAVRVVLVTLSILGSALPARAADRAPSAISGREAAPAAGAVDREARAPAEPPLDTSDRVIRKAIADAKDPLDNIPTTHGAAFGAGPPTRRQAIDERFAAADMPSCLTPDVYRFDPPMLGPLRLSGLLALPFWAHAIVTNRCRH